MDEGRYTIIGIAAAIILAAVTWLFHAGNYRSNVYQKWSRERIGTIVAGLDEHAANSIYQLLQLIQSDYGYISSKEFWPYGPLPDPVSYRPYIRRYTKAQRYKERFQADVDLLLKLGYVIVATLTLLIIGAALVLLHFTVEFEINAIVRIGFALSSLSILVALTTLFGHIALNNRLTNVEMLSEKDLENA